MSRIKAQLLSLYTKVLIKSRRVERTNVGFRQAKSIGILYSGDAPKKQEGVDWLTTQLNQLGKQVTMLCYVPPHTQATGLSVPTVTNRDVQLWGGITSPTAKAFVDTPFDYLYQVDLESSPVPDYLLAKSHAKCRVGHYDASRVALFEVMVSFERRPDSNEIADLAAQMLHYTHLLKAK